ncbi:hypothetical protein V2J09_002344 [Rumex salicifolius]
MAPCCCPRSVGMGGVEKENCGDCRIWEEELYWNRFQSLYFCQNLSLVSDFHKQLAIPKKFAENARALLPLKITLRGPSRATWCCVITKKGDDMLLIEGWVEFVRAYSLQATEILIFKFDGVSVFDILIFDGENLCEKESAYFVKKCRHENAENARKRTVSEADIEEDEDAHIPRPTKQAGVEAAANETPNRSNYTQFYSRLRKKRLRNSKFSQSGPKKLFPLKISNHAAENGQSNVQNEPSNNVNEPQNTEMNGSPETETPVQICPSATNGSFSTKTPPQGTSHINESIILEATPLRVASARGRPRKGSGLKASSGILTSSVGRKRKQLNSNKDGEEFSLGSHDSSSRRYVPEEGILALEMARKQMNASSFMLLMRASAVCKRFILTLPPAWCRKHLSPTSQDVFFQFGHQTFKTRLCYRPGKTTGQICGGWKLVVLKTQLKLYDVCLFNIVSEKGNAVMLDVSVFRGGMQRELVLPTRLQIDEPSSLIRDVE